MIANPALAANPDAPPLIPNRGVNIGFTTEKKLRQFRFYYWHMYRIQRPFVAAQATIQRLTRTWELKIQEDEEEDDGSIPDPSHLAKIEDVRKTLEDLDNVLSTERDHMASL